MSCRDGEDRDGVVDCNHEGVREIEAYRRCKSQQKRWAMSKGLSLIGSRGNRGEPAYTTTLDDNLFEPLSAESRREIERGDGDELAEKGGPPKMHAVHSSAALTVNMFHYWRHQPSLQPILDALGLPGQQGTSLEFEAKRPIMDTPDRKVFRVDPNLDVVIHCRPEGRVREIAIECKFTEPYRSIKPEDKGLKWPYFKEYQLWSDIPACHELAKRIKSRDGHFRHLHAAQLLKHILGLKHQNGREGFHLIYLWYDVPHQEAIRHREEIAEFRELVTRDGIAFSDRTFQDLIGVLSDLRPQHGPYVDYLTQRYLHPLIPLQDEIR